MVRSNSSTKRHDLVAGDVAPLLSELEKILNVDCGCHPFSLDSTICCAQLPPPRSAFASQPHHNFCLAQLYKNRQRPRGLRSAYPFWLSEDPWVGRVRARTLEVNTRQRHGLLLERGDEFVHGHGREGEGLNGSAGAELDSHLSYGLVAGSLEDVSEVELDRGLRTGSGS